MKDHIACSPSKVRRTFWRNPPRGPPKGTDHYPGFDHYEIQVQGS